MPLSPLLLIHICGAIVGLLSGYLAMFLRKGSGLHGAAGSVFFVSMIAMSTSAAYIATYQHPIMINVVAGSLTFYLVTTAWWTARNQEGRTSIVDRAAFLFVLIVAAGALASGFEAAGNPNGALDRIPAAVYFIFGFVALLHVLGDIRMLVRGGAAGARRIARHLSRMCVALLIATLSFYPGQARLFPESWRGSFLLFVPHILLIGSMIFWKVRVRARRRAQESKVISDEEVMIERAAA